MLPNTAEEPLGSVIKKKQPASMIINGMKVVDGSMFLSLFIVIPFYNLKIRVSAVSYTHLLISEKNGMLSSIETVSLFTILISE